METRKAIVSRYFSRLGKLGGAAAGRARRANKTPEEISAAMRALSRKRWHPEQAAQGPSAQQPRVDVYFSDPPA